MEMSNEISTTRPALKEITANDWTSSGGSPSSKPSPRVQTPNSAKRLLQRQQLEAGCESSNNQQRAEEVKYLLDKTPINPFEIRTTPDKFKDIESRSNTSSPQVLPDIINVQPAEPAKGKSIGDDENLISSLASNLNNALNLNTSRGLSHPSTSSKWSPEAGTSAVSSDDELFAECQSYPVSLNATANVENAGVIITNDFKLNTSSSQWDDLVSSVISTNAESLENTLEVIDSHLDLSPREFVAADSTTSNVDSNNTTAEAGGQQFEFSAGGEVFEEVVSSGQFEGTADTDEILEECAQALNYQLESSRQAVGGESIPEDKRTSFPPSFPLKNSSSQGQFPTSPEKPVDNFEFPKNGEELNATVESGEENRHLDDTVPISSDIRENSLSRSQSPFSGSVDSLKKSTSISQLNTTVEGVSSIDLNATQDISRQSSNGSLQQVSRADSVSSEALNQNAEMVNSGNAPNLNNTIDVVVSSQTPEKSTKPIGSLVHLNSTFAASSEALNSTVNIGLNRTFGGSHELLSQPFNGTFSTRAVSLPPPSEISEENLSADQTRSIASDHSGLNESVEPMDVDMGEPSPRKDATEAVSESPFENSANSLEFLSEKEKDKAQSVEKEMDFAFKAPTMPAPVARRSMEATSSTAPAEEGPTDDDFGGNNFILNPSDFDFLLTKGSNNVHVDRSSLLLRFDPLLGHSVAVNQPSTQSAQALINPVVNQLTSSLIQQQPPAKRLSPAVEEDEHEDKEEQSLNGKSQLLTAIKQEPKSPIAENDFTPRSPPIQITTRSIKKNDKMSVDVIQDMKFDNEQVKSIDGLNSQLDDKHNNIKMDELENKIKNEVLKTEDIEKKLKDAEQREEALLKRITEKDKTITKMTGVIEAYEKAIAELIAEKEQIIQNYEKQIAEVKADRDSNYQHLTSLETTFTDLHIKYEKSKEMTAQLKASEEDLMGEKKQLQENLRLQEQRYEKMKNHAMQQLEIANKKLETLTKNHTTEITKLKALLKKEEISRASINEQLTQKTRENEELVKICDELINGQGS